MKQNQLNLRIEKKSYKINNGKTHTVLNQIRIELRESEFYCLIGKSGCGKTTLLNIISGLDGEYTGVRNTSSANLKIAYVFQEPCLLPWKTVRKNLELITERKNFSEIKEILTEFKILDFIDSYPKELSLGMARRVSIARAILYHPKIILLDEPFVSLDMHIVEQLQDMIIRLWKQYKICIIMVTHDLRQALKLGRRLIFLGNSPTQTIDEKFFFTPYEERDFYWVEEQFSLFFNNRKTKT